MPPDRAQTQAQIEYHSLLLRQVGPAAMLVGVGIATMLWAVFGPGAAATPPEGGFRV